MARKSEILWKLFAGATLVAQVTKISNTLPKTATFSLPDAFDWIMSFPECVVVCLFATSFAVGTPVWWRLFSFLYPFYAFFVVCVCLNLYVFQAIPSGHPIPYGLAMLLVTVMKVFSAYAIWHYGREPAIWRWQAEAPTSSMRNSR